MKTKVSTSLLGMAALLVSTTVGGCDTTDVRDHSGDGGADTAPGEGEDGGFGACLGVSSGNPFSLVSGRYRAVLSAEQTAACGLEPQEAQPPAAVFLTVQVSDSAIEIAPGDAATLTLIRQGNALCGTDSREYRHTDNGALCVLNEGDQIHGEVTKDGSFWVDLLFDWSQKGGDCSALTLPCSGTHTWTFDFVGYEVPAGTFVATVESVAHDECGTSVVVGTSRDYSVTTDDSTLTYCWDAGSCSSLERNGNHLSGTQPVSFPSGCQGTQTHEGEILSGDSFTLTRTSVGTLCTCSTRFVQTFQRK